MHLLGRSITVELNPGRPGARTLLDVNRVQLRRPARVAAAAAGPGRGRRRAAGHLHPRRDAAPGTCCRGVPPRYVVWGDGTTDEMCLGIVIRD